MAWTFYNSSGETLTSFGPVTLSEIDIDGGTDIGEAIVDADLFIIDNGAGGTNRKTAASRILTYVGGAVPAQANQAALEAETNQDTYIPPDLVKHSPGVAKFWVKYDGASAAIQGTAYNVGSVTDGGTGDHTVNITTDFSSAHWCATMASRTAGTGSDIRVETMAAGTLRVLSGDGSSAADSTYECIAGFGDQ